jgi:phospholipase C
MSVVRLLSALLAATLALSVSAASARRPATTPCGTGANPPRVFAHVIWIWMENHSYDGIVGSSDAPFLNQLARGCGLAASYRGVAHPSLPNYIAATSGDTQGVADDGSPSGHPLSAVSIFEQARSAKSYEESMPSPCRLTPSGSYAVKHNPQAYYLRIRKACRTNDVPMGTPTAGGLTRALRRDTLPQFSFLTPNLCNDMHDCSVSTGDAWLSRWMRTITASPTYRRGTTVVFVTWDEDDGSSGNRVATIVVSPYTKPDTRSSRPFTHYSLLRTTEELLGIRARLGRAASAPSMRTAFGL